MRIRQFTKRFPIILTITAATFLASVLAAPLFEAPAAKADFYGNLSNLLMRGEPSGGYVSAVSTDVALLVKYVGPSTSGKVAVAANGDLTFTDGAEGSEAAVTDFECPVSGALGGVIDVSDAACNTLGEVVDVINGSCSTCAGTASKWRAVILDGKRSDSSDDSIVTIAATAATSNDGLALNWDAAVRFTSTLALGTCRSMSCFLSQRSGSAAYPLLLNNPWKGTRTVLWKDLATSTYGSGTSTFSIEQCLVNQGPTAGAETCSTLWSQAGAATTVTLTNDWTDTGLFAGKDYKMLARITNSAAMSAATHAVYGTTYPYNSP